MIPAGVPECNRSHADASLAMSTMSLPHASLPLTRRQRRRDSRVEEGPDLYIDGRTATY